MKLTAIVAGITLLVGFLLLPGVARAGGWAVLSLDQVPTGVVSGKEFSIGFKVLAHGRHPVEGLKIRIEATHQGSGRQLVFSASDSGDPGHYSTTIILPEAGTWEWVVVTFGGPHVMYPLQVHPAGPLEGGGTEADVASAREFWHWLAMASGAGAGLTLLATAGVAVGVPRRMMTQGRPGR